MEGLLTSCSFQCEVFSQSLVCCGCLLLSVSIVLLSLLVFWLLAVSIEFHCENFCCCWRVARVSTGKLDCFHHSSINFWPESTKRFRIYFATEVSAIEEWTTEYFSTHKNLAISTNFRSSVDEICISSIHSVSELLVSISENCWAFWISNLPASVIKSNSRKPGKWSDLVTQKWWKLLWTLQNNTSFCCLQSRMCVTNEGCDCETTLADSLVKFLVLLLVVHDHFDNQTVIRITFTQIPTQPSHEQKFVNQNRSECDFDCCPGLWKGTIKPTNNWTNKHNKVKTHHPRNNEEGQRRPEHLFWQISFLYFDWMFEVEKRRMNCE